MSIEWLSSHSRDAYITLDSQNRIYISAAARKAIGLPDKTPFHLAIGYDADARRLVVARPEDVKTDGVDPFKFDSRSYSKAARAVLRGAGIETDKRPLKFPLIGDGEASKQRGLAYPSKTYAFDVSTE